MLYVDAAHPELARPCTVLATNPNGTVNLRVTEPSGTFDVDSVPVIAVGSPAPTMGFFAQVEKTPEQVQAEQQAAANEATLNGKLDAALAANDAFLALASPTNAQVVAQVRALTRQNSAVIRLRRGKLDSTSGT